MQLRIQELVQSNCDVLTTVTWDLILQITSRILSFAKTDCKDDPHNYVKIMTAVNNTLDAIEAILFTKSFCGEVEQFFDLVDSCYLSRPVICAKFYYIFVKVYQTMKRTTNLYCLI